VPFDAVLGGGMSIVRPRVHLISPSLLAAEDVLGDLGVRQAMRKMPKTSRL
jgi:hypothetical protein